MVFPVIHLQNVSKIKIGNGKEIPLTIIKTELCYLYLINSVLTFSGMSIIIVYLVDLDRL